MFRMIGFIMVVALLATSLALKLSAGTRPAGAVLLPSATPRLAPTPSGEILVEQARLLHRADRPTAALNLLDRALAVGDLDQTSAFRAYFLRGRIHKDRDEFELAFADLTRAIELQPDIAEVYAHRAELQADVEDALVDYSRAIDYDASEPAYYVARGRAYLVLESTNLARLDFDQAIALDSDNPEPYFYRAQSYVMIEQHADAIQDFDTALSLDPDNPLIYRERGYAWLASGEDDKALIDFVAYLDRAPDAPDRLDIQAEIEELQGP